MYFNLKKYGFSLQKQTVMNESNVFYLHAFSYYLFNSIKLQSKEAKLKIKVRGTL